MSSVQIEFYGDPCRSCRYSWIANVDDLMAEVLALGTAYRATLRGLPGTARHPELGWCAAAYVLHVADNLRMHGERMAAASRGAQFEFVHADQDELAAVRSYETIPIEGALWSLETVLVPYIETFRDAFEAGVILRHPIRGDQFATDVLRGNVHDAHHHNWDLQRIADANLA
jgi:hypothetical protein